MDAISSKLFKRRRTIHEQVTIMDLPKLIIVDIISRLSIKSIFSCKCVCKPWYSLPSDPLFADMYHTRSSRFPCLLLSVDDSVTSILELNKGYDYSSDPQNRPVMLRPITFKFSGVSLKPKFELIGSCNGFICLLNGRHSIYISNPLLGEYFKLKFPKLEIENVPVAYAFCFSEISGQYKVFRSVTRRRFYGRPKVSELEVYTLGVDKKWRNVGNVPQCPMVYSFRNANVNGSLYWLDGSLHGGIPIIYRFNIETEKVKSVLPPPTLGASCCYLTLTELRNCLCLANNSIYYSTIDIWRMEVCGIYELWTKCNHISLASLLPRGIFTDVQKPIIIWKDGEILMQRRCNNELVSYNQKKKQFRKVRVFGGGGAATTYLPSFYSLKTVMGDNFQVSNVYTKTQIV